MEEDERRIQEEVGMDPGTRIVVFDVGSLVTEPQGPGQETSVGNWLDVRPGMMAAGHIADCWFDRMGDPEGCLSGGRLRVLTRLESTLVL